MKWIFALIAMCLLSLHPAAATAQTMQSLGEQLHVYLITLGPGADPWEKFGHDFIDVEDPSGLLNNYVDRNDGQPLRQVSYNWGVFDFSAGMIPFGWHFMQGKLRYSMEAMPTSDVIKVYTAEGRYILKQELNLTADQKLGLLSRLQENDTPANRYYLYDYFVKNCSTMTRDAIDQTADSRVHDALAKLPTGTTLRWQSLRCTADDLWLYVFLDYALGRPTDQPLSAWEECFLPMKLSAHLRDVMVPGPDGKMMPLVKSEELLNVGVYPLREIPPTWYFYGFLASGIIFGGLLCLLAFLGDRSRLARWGFKILGTSWSLVVGLGGTLLSLAWLTDHQAAKWNENWFQGNFLSLALVVLIPAAIKWPNAARKVAFVVLGLSAFNLLAKVTPWFYQANGSLIAVALPIHAAIAWGIVRLNTTRKPPAVVVEIPKTVELRAA